MKTLYLTPDDEKELQAFVDLALKNLGTQALGVAVKWKNKLAEAATTEQPEKEQA